MREQHRSHNHFCKLPGRIYIFLTAAVLSTLTGATTPRAWGGVVSKQYTNTIAEGTFTYWVTTPSGYNPSTAYPLIVNFPGMGREKPAAQQGYSYSRRFMFDQSFADATPASRVLATNHIGIAVNYCGWLASYGSDAAKTTMAMLDEVRRNYKIDPKRIFALGFSAGGAALDEYVWGNSYFTATNSPWAGVMVCACNGSAGNTQITPKTMPVFLEYGTAGDVPSCIAGTRSRYDNLAAAGYKDLDGGVHAIAGQAHEISGYERLAPGLHPNANELIAAWWVRVNAAISGSTNPPSPKTDNLKKMAR